MNPETRTFASQLRPHVARLGTKEVARVCGVTQRTVQLWIVGLGNPNAATQRGVVELLREAPAKKGA